jgi:superoxide reductase
MNKFNKIYKCEVCGNVVSILRGKIGKLVCCGQNMKLEDEKSEDNGMEKHIPVIEKLSNEENGWIIKIGEVEHPMDKEHFIEWIEIVTSDEKISRKFLKPGDNPKAEFQTKYKITQIRSYCNLHGLWKLDL